MPAMMAKKRIRVAIVGCGTVGGATADLCIRDRALIARRSGVDVEIAAIVGGDFKHARELGLPEDLLTTDLDSVLNDGTIDLVVETVGGIDFPRSLITRALDAGKHVVTANKALLAHHGEELFAHARRQGLSIGFEASCGGGIPLVRAITDGLIANEIEAIYGIVNGTSNYILTEMIQKGETYPEALAKAQSTGLAESDPSMDVQGTDSAHKIAILSALAFGIKVDFEIIPVIGIDTLDSLDVAYGQDLGYVVKLLAVAHRDEEGVSIWVRPAFISKEHPLAWVSGPFNAVSIYGHAVGHTLFYGRGAGGEPTSSAVASDIVSVGLGIIPAVFENTGYWPDRNDDVTQLAEGRSNSQFYMRIMAADKPGVLATIGSILAKERISIASLRQNEQALEEELIPLVITTHICPEAAINRAVREIEALPVTGETVVVMPIVDEHPERVG
ncbi:MAG: homoserine dehydrogenase [Spirochaetaceae bacterium]|nr:MAG: homoserine dehydrogenase [Spirochaetaceae bacterium]